MDRSESFHISVPIKRSILAIAIAFFGMVMLQSCDSGGNNNSSAGNTGQDAGNATENTTADNMQSDNMQNSRNDGGTAEMENTDVVPSGTYTGTAQQVDPEEKEIYVRTNDNKTLELYLDEQTELTENGKSVSFDALEQGQQLEVTVEKNGDQLQPVAIDILSR